MLLALFRLRDTTHDACYLQFSVKVALRNNLANNIGYSHFQIGFVLDE